MRVATNLKLTVGVEMLQVLLDGEWHSAADFRPAINAVLDSHIQRIPRLAIEDPTRQAFKISLILVRLF
jgi:hypothetical protein